MKRVFKIKLIDLKKNTMNNRFLFFRLHTPDYTIIHKTIGWNALHERFDSHIDSHSNHFEFAASSFQESLFI